MQRAGGSGQLAHSSRTGIVARMRRTSAAPRMLGAAIFRAVRAGERREVAAGGCAANWLAAVSAFTLEHVGSLAKLVHELGKAAGAVAAILVDDLHGASGEKFC